MPLQKKAYNTVFILPFIFFPIQSKAEDSSLCKPYHLPLNKIKVSNINSDNLSDFMNGIWKSSINRDKSSIVGKEGKTQCWKIGEWNNSLCIEPVKLYQRKIHGDKYIFLLTTQHIDLPGDGCWSANSDDCNQGATHGLGNNILGIFSFKKVQKDVFEPTSYSGFCEYEGAMSPEDINLQKDGSNSYTWGVNMHWVGFGEIYTSTAMLPAFSKKKLDEIANFTVYHDNSGVEDRKERIDKVEYSFIRNHNEHYNLQLKHYCADIRYPKNMDMDVLEKKTQGAIKYQRSLISKYSINDLRYELPNTSAKGWSDVITWFSKRAHCPVRYISK